MPPRFFAVLLAVALLASARAQTPDFSALNAAFGVQTWGDDTLWDDADTAVADRLGWPEESRTSTTASFRAYPNASARLLGARPYSVVLYGRDGHPEQISMVFANKGDTGGDTKNGRPDLAWKKQIGADSKTIADALTRVLGPAKATQYGDSARTRERVDRWDWNGHAILLAAPRGEYVAVRILPTATADGETAARVTDTALKETLRERVERRPNGDVVLRDIPMVNQGPKGYCVPATYERALRYVGIPADMYVLAMAGQTDAGGGTSIPAMMAGASDIVRRNGRRFVTESGRVDTRLVSSYIDKGLPLLWAMFVDETLNATLTARAAQRRGVTDWTAYTDMLKPQRKAARAIRIDRENGHVCMIIGYNARTGEIAISDSWGPQYAERWITEEEAAAISQGQFTIVNW